MGNKDKKLKSTPKKNNLWLVVGGAVLMVGIVWFTMKSTTQTAQLNKTPAVLVATLAPDSFVGKAKAAYQAAKEIPEILAQLPCFCGCMENLGHKSNLDCFADDHGGECDLCQSIALDAKEMHSKGMSTEKIRDNIRTAYAHIQ